MDFCTNIRARNAISQSGILILILGGQGQGVTPSDMPPKQYASVHPQSDNMQFYVGFPSLTESSADFLNFAEGSAGCHLDEENITWNLHSCHRGTSSFKSTLNLSVDESFDFLEAVS